METHIFFIHFLSFFLFKSYYVVWKPVERQFKTIELFLFKSYYVVWKPANRASAVPIPISLNRTM